MAVYRLNPDGGAHVESVRIRPASVELVDEWIVTWPIGVIDTPTSGMFFGVEVLQDLGESAALTARQTRRLAPGRALRVASQVLRDDIGGAPAWVTELLGTQTELLGPDWRALIERAIASDPSSRRHLLAATAALYVAAIDGGDRTPVTSVAQQLDLEQPQVRDRLYKARQLELLEPLHPGRGRAQGRLTPAAIDLLRKEGSA